MPTRGGNEDDPGELGRMATRRGSGRLAEADAMRPPVPLRGRRTRSYSVGGKSNRNGREIRATRIEVSPEIGG